MGTFRHGKKSAFLKAYARCGNISDAAKAAKCHRNAHYNWIKENPIYAKRFADAEERYVERLEAEADRRGKDGTEEPVFYQGEQCGTKLRYSDTLLIFRLKALRPEKYRERSEIEHRGASEPAKVLEDEDWYGNAVRVASKADGPSEGSAVVPGTSQVRSVRKTLGKNGDGASGNGERPR